MDEKAKLCCTCKNVLPIIDFWPKKNSKDGFSAKCKNCSNKYLREWKIKNKKILEDKKLKLDNSRKCDTLKIDGI